MQVSERMVLAQKAYILFYIRKQPENGRAAPAAPAAQQRPSTAPPAQRTASLAREDSLQPNVASAGELDRCAQTGQGMDALQEGEFALRQCVHSLAWGSVGRGFGCS